MNLVSILMPCYNMENYISKSIDTVLSQTYTNWELLIVDDASTDHSREIVQSYAAKDSRIQLLSLAQNQGIANARNAALEKAKGRYIAFLDSDDFWLAEKLETQLEFMKKTGAAFSFTAFHQIAENGTFIKTIAAPSSLTYSELLKKNVVGCLTVMIDRNLAGNFSMPSLKHEDFATWLALLKTTVPVAHGLNIPLSKYNVRQGSTSRNKIKSMSWVYNIYKVQEHMSIPKSFLFILRWFMFSLKK